MNLQERLNTWLRYWMARSYYFKALIHRYVGHACAAMWEYEKAIDDFSRAIEYDPDFAQAYLNRGILYWREIDHPRRAIMDLTTAHTLNPNLNEAQFNRGVAYQQLREYENAVRDFKAYLAVGEHLHWREYAENMIQELDEWLIHTEWDK